MKEECANKAEWLALQPSYIGGSRAASACGVSDYGSPLEVYLGLCGMLPPREATREMEFGTLWEPFVAQEYASRTGRVLIHNGWTLWRHDRYRWLACTPDYLVEGDETRGVQCKTARSERARSKETGRYEVVWGEEGGDSIPVDYLIQCQHEMAATGWQAVDVPVFFRETCETRIYTVERNESLIERIISLEGELWNRVLMRYPPPPDWRHPATPDLVALLHRPQKGLVVTLADPELARLASAYRASREEYNRLDRELKIARGRFAEVMGEAAEALLSDGQRLKRSTTNVRGGERKPSTRTNFKVIPPEGEEDDGEDES